MSGIAVAIAGAAVVGALVQNDASHRAADTQEEASRRANDTQLSIYNTQRADAQPWQQAGINALGDLNDNKFMDNWQTDPGYQFRMDQGNKAINAAAAARGNFGNGGTMKALTRYGQDYASSEYNNVYNRQYNRLSALAGFGQNANNSANASGSNYANANSANLMGAANAQSAGTIASANATSSALGTGANAYMQYNMMNQMFPKQNASSFTSTGGYGSTYGMDSRASGSSYGSGGNYLGGNYNYSY